jgi:DNA repair exonuclease SbcCD ATPase subunit
MTRRTLIAFGLAGILATTACADANLSETTLGVPGTTTTEATSATPETDLDPSAAIAELQQRMSELATEIQGSEAAAELQARWEQVQTEMASALASIQEDGRLDTTSFESMLQEFEDDLETLGDQVEPEVREAWATFRESLDRLAG